MFSLSVSSLPLRVLDLVTAVLALAAITPSVPAKGSQTPAVHGPGQTVNPPASMASTASPGPWKLAGNSNTIPGSDFLGTIDNKTLSLRVFNTRTMQYAYVSNGNYHSNNALGGTDINSITPGTIGATIAGGGQDFFVGVDYPNAISADFGTIGGGGGHSVSGYAATIAGGAVNTASNQDAAVGGGRNNTASGKAAVVPGGDDNVASGYFSCVSGGQFSTASGDRSAIGGGTFNLATGLAATAAGGFQSNAAADYTSVGGGLGNNSFNTYDTVSGGNQNSATGPAATIGGGNQNAANNQYVTVSGGNQNNASGDTATIGGGLSNVASNEFTVVGGGRQNIASGLRSTVGGGFINTASQSYDTVAGGRENIASGSDSTVGGGHNNSATFIYAVVAGGNANVASDTEATVSGGEMNAATARGATVSGGVNNAVSAVYGAIPGGSFNLVQGQFGFAAGQQAQCLHDGSFVWSDSTNSTFSSTVADQFQVRAAGGTNFYSNSTATTGVSLAAGSSTWTGGSDRALKENIEAVDGREVLARLVEVPIATWNYRAQGDGVQHMGPMAQDFYAAFALGLGDKTIDYVDSDGVAFAAIQGLHALVQEQRDHMEAQDAKIAELEGRLAKLEERRN